MSELMEQIRKVRVKAGEKVPYFRHVIFRLNMIELDDFPHPMGVDDNWNLYYNPSHINDWSLEEMCTVLIHEAHHVIRNHTSWDVDQQHISNIAMDMAVNDDLDEAGMKFPGGTDEIALPENFDMERGQTARYYYRKLLEKIDNDEIDYQTVHIPQSAGQADEGSSEGSQGGSEGENEGGMGCPGCNCEHVPDADEHEEAMEIDDAINELQRESALKEVEQKLQGNLPNEIQREIDKIRDERKVDWQTELRNVTKKHCTQPGYIDYTFSRPNREQDAYDPFIFPSMVGGKTDLCVVVDTSGSMSGGELSQALNEVYQISRTQTVDRLTVSCWDAEKHNTETFHGMVNPKRIDMVGGGGTDMAKAIREETENHNVVVVFTDGYTDWSETTNGSRVIILLSEGGVEKEEVPDMYDVISMD